MHDIDYRYIPCPSCGMRKARLHEHQLTCRSCGADVDILAVVRQGNMACISAEFIGEVQYHDPYLAAELKNLWREYLLASRQAGRKKQERDYKKLYNQKYRNEHR